VLYLKADSVGKNKLESRWSDGIWLGIRDESGESIIGTSEGIVKCRDFRRRPTDQERWNDEQVKAVKGAPWKPVPGKEDGAEIRIRINFPAEGRITRRPEFAEDVYNPKRTRIKEEDLKKFGHTVGCPGCRAKSRGLTAQSHTEECRKRIVEKLREAGDLRIEKERQRFEVARRVR